MQGLNTIGYYGIMTKFILVMYICSMVSGKCPDHHIPGYSFETHAACVEYGYRVAHGTFKNLGEIQDFEKEYIESHRIVVRFDCRAVKVQKPVVPLPKPKVTT